MMTHSADNRRSFSRVPFTANAHIFAQQGDIYLNCPVIDVSLNGLLIRCPDNWSGHLDDVFKVDLLLESGQIVINMQATVAHMNRHTVGFHCQLIDLDSITHLKRLIELNLADEGLLHRELSALLDRPD